MSVSQTGLIGLVGTGPDNHFLADANVTLGAANWTLGLFIQCIALVADTENPEPIFSTRSGNTGLLVTRSGSGIGFRTQIGTGAATESRQSSVHSATAIGAGLFVHLTYDSESTTLTTYVNGSPADTFVLDNPMVQGVAPRLGSAIGVNTVNNSTVLLAAGIGSLFDADAVENDVARAMTFHTFRPANYAHLWSFQSDAVRDIPPVLQDVGAIGGVPMSRVGSGGSARHISDVQFTSPVVAGG